MVEFRELGRNTQTFVQPIGLGCMGMSEFYGEGNEQENLTVLNRAIELGCTFWDTADVYGLGENERLLSKVLKDNRDKIFLCTKFSGVRDEKTGEFLGINGKPEYVREACEKSLKRLGVDTIDLYYQHRIDKNTPIEETVKAMAELVKEGKVRYLGLSECSAETLRRAHKVHPISAIQMEYSPWSLDIESNGVLTAARELGVSIVCYSPLGRAMFTDDAKPSTEFESNDFRRYVSRFEGEHFDKNKVLVNKIKGLAAKKGVPLSEYVLAWILAQGPEFIIIPGTKRIKYLESNFKAGEIKLTTEEVAEMRSLLQDNQFSGPRYDGVQATYLDE
ncbi:aldo/keto reductase [Phascolomyces articulosus]|uniref:Aldo/keto reductase n=1 Tax=Phascolomyces articulosus TaxID=60185 RepID=A0AAD5K4J4_9FUNG|nr:aldo/keto reductase [Phascolomyces articulosus]